MKHFRREEDVMARVLKSVVYSMIITIICYIFFHDDMSSIKPTVQETMQTSTNLYKSENMLIIGDSRMYAAAKIFKEEHLFFVAKSGVSCNYLWEEAEQQADAILAEYPDEHFSIFINLGVNDLDRVAKLDNQVVCDAETYANYYLQLKEKWNQHNLFFVSVNPVNEKKLKIGRYKNSQMTNNKAIKEFNEKIVSIVKEHNIYYCDTYTSLITNGFESTDGLHYSDESTREIIELVKNCYTDEFVRSILEPITSRFKKNNGML